MWAQLMTMQLKAEAGEEDLVGVLEALDAAEQPGSGLLRSTVTTATDDPRRVHWLVVFESEEAARARESDPDHEQALGPVRERMGAIFEGPPTFTDLHVVAERSY